MLTPPGPILVATSRLARLSHVQWTNAVRDLLKLSDVTTVAAAVTGDAVVGLDNDSASLFVGDQLRADLETAAQTLATQVTGTAASLAKLVPAGAPTDLAGKANAFITSFGLRAYRRPLTTAEVQAYATLFNQGPTLYPGVDAFTAGANLVIQTILQSPYFLYRTELGTAVANGMVALSDYEVAAKLSLALTNTIPDDALMTAAGQGKVHAAADVTAQATRLLPSAAGAGGRDHLHFQIYRLGAYDGIVRDMTVFPAFTTQTPADMRQEVLAFTRWIFDQGYGVKELFTSPVSFVNSNLAPLYGLTGSFTAAFTQVSLDATKRGGILTQPGFLSSYSVINDPDTIHRGVFINQRILCVELPPPDPNATALPTLDSTMTNRQRVEATTGPGTCGAGCHSTIINPPGFAFEEFDAVGTYRTMDRGQPIDASSSYMFTEGLKTFNGAVEFDKLLAQGIQAHACYVQNWMMYVNGRTVVPAEKPLVDYLAQVSQSGKLPMTDLIVDLVTAPGFLNRLP